MPYGFGGVVSGAASCFFAYIGFDGLSSAAEEATSECLNEQRNCILTRLRPRQVNPYRHFRLDGYCHWILHSHVGGTYAHGAVQPNPSHERIR